MIRPTILWALSLAMLGGALFGLAFSLRRPPAQGRRASREVGPLPASRKSSGEGECGHGSTHRVPSPVFVLAAARYGSTPSYAACLQALARIHRASQSGTGVSHQQPVASRPHAAGLRPH